MRARLRVEGMDTAIRRVDDVGDRARMPEPAMRSSGTLFDLQQSERRKFARGGWRRISPEWVREKRRRGLDTRTLRATGLLESAMTNATHGVKVRVWNGVMTWGLQAGRSDIYYAQALSKRRGDKPARRMVVIDKPAVQSISLRIERYIADGHIR